MSLVDLMNSKLFAHTHRCVDVNALQFLLLDTHIHHTRILTDIHSKQAVK